MQKYFALNLCLREVLMDATLNAITAYNNTAPSIYTYCLTEYKITFRDLDTMSGFAVILGYCVVIPHAATQLLVSLLNPCNIALVQENHAKSISKRIFYVRRKYRTAKEWHPGIRGLERTSY